MMYQAVGPGTSDAYSACICGSMKFLVWNAAMESSAEKAAKVARRSGLRRLREVLLDDHREVVDARAVLHVLRECRAALGHELVRPVDAVAVLVALHDLAAQAKASVGIAPPAAPMTQEDAAVAFDAQDLEGLEVLGHAVQAVLAALALVDPGAHLGAPVAVGRLLRGQDPAEDPVRARLGIHQAQVFAHDVQVTSTAASVTPKMAKAPRFDMTSIRSCSLRRASSSAGESSSSSLVFGARTFATRNMDTPPKKSASVHPCQLRQTPITSAIAPMKSRSTPQRTEWRVFAFM